MKHLDFVIVKCPICNSGRYKVLYPDSLGQELPKIGYNFSPGTNRTYRIVICKDCGHGYSSPRPLNLWQSYEEVEDAVYLKYQLQRILTAKRVIRRLLHYCPSGKLCDIGCSLGDFLSIAKQFYQVEGIELSKLAANIARDRGFVVHNQRLESISVSSPYDIITMWGVIEHLEYPRREIENLYKLLKLGGFVCLWTGDRESLLSRLLGKKWWYIQGQHIQLFSRRSLLKLFNDCGFEKVWIGRYPYVMTLESIGQSLMRYRLIGKIARNILEHRAIANRVITLSLPGEMFAIFRKR